MPGPNSKRRAGSALGRSKDAKGRPHVAETARNSGPPPDLPGCTAPPHG
ncbi:MAG: hypothetical protein LBK61_00950 [Spirochaetaceae bacterium]|nr:hypothetical protein [Spirochaetaceae bacterium]